MTALMAGWVGNGEAICVFRSICVSVLQDAPTPDRSRGIG